MQTGKPSTKSKLKRKAVLYALRHLPRSNFDISFLGSEKGEDDIGKYGEGFKAATVCILRRAGTTVVAASGSQGVVIRLAEEPAEGTTLFPFVYDFYDLDKSVPGCVLLIDGTWRALDAAMKVGLTHFFFDQNPLLGSRIAQDGDDYQVYRSTNATGHIFYRNLKRGEIPDIPIVLVLNKPYDRIEKQIAKDRDRKAFGDPVRETFYALWAQHFFFRQSRQEPIVAAAKPVWEQGRGHPLLAAIARVSKAPWSEDGADDLFEKAYYAESQTTNLLLLARFQDIEAHWVRENRRRLPGYFNKFGVMSAERHIEKLNEIAKAEARKKGARRPSRAEAEAITVLRDVLQELAPTLASFHSVKAMSYTVAATDVLLGEFKEQRGYRTLEIFLAESLFVADFAHALAVFLHEHAHVHGYDGSRSFTDALTELIETIVRDRLALNAHESYWQKAVEVVAAERKKAGEGPESNLLAELEPLDRDALLRLVRGLPRSLVAQALKKHQA